MSDPIEPPRPASDVLPGVLSRARELRRQRVRRRRAARLLPVAAVVLLVGALVAQGDDPSASRLETTRHPEVPTTPAPSIVVAGPGPSTSTPLNQPPADPVTAPQTVGTSSTSPDRGAPPRIAVSFDQRLDGGTWKSAVLRPGANAVTLVSGATAERQYPGISPDGRRVVFQSTQSNLLAGIRTVWELYTVSADGTGQRQITSMPLDSGNGSTFASWSSDGNRLVFNCVTGQQRGLCTATPDGTGLTLVADQSRSFFLARWSPDGHRLAALRDIGGRHEVWTMAPNGSSQRRVPTPDFVRLDGPPVWVDGASRLLYTRPTRLTGADPDFGDIVSLDVASGAVTSAGLPQGGVVVSCGGDRLVFVTHQDIGPAKRGDLIAIDPDGGRPQVLLRGVGRSLVPSSCSRPLP